MLNNPENTNQGLDSKSIFKAWLEKLQQESWQLELIISGFVLYGIYSAKGLIHQISFYNDDHIAGPLSNMFEVIIIVGWLIFFTNLLIHVILRSLWIGAIGLRYVSGEINYDELNYSSTFTQYLRRKVGDYDDFISKLEKICSVLFSYTFLLFLFFVSIIVFGVVVIAPILLIEWSGYEIDDHLGKALLWIIPVLIGGLIVFIDFVTLGGLKRIKDRRFAKIYLPIYWFYSHITLSFLYRPILYNFIDDKYTRRLFFFSFPYIFLISGMDDLYTHNDTVYIQTEEAYAYGTQIDPYYYDDLFDRKIAMQTYLSDEVLRPEPLYGIRLSQYKVTEPYLQLFVKYNPKYDDVIEKVHGISPHYQKGWVFSMFSDDHRIVDSTEYALKDSFKMRERAVYAEYKVYRDSIFRLRKDTLLKAIVTEKRDSLSQLRSDLYEKRKAGIEDFRARKRARIHQIMKAQISLSIDDVPYNDSVSCYMTTHYLHDNEGMVYNIPVAHLPKGDHTLLINRVTSYNEKEDSIHRITYRMPILKIQ